MSMQASIVWRLILGVSSTLALAGLSFVFFSTGGLRALRLADIDVPFNWMWGTGLTMIASAFTALVGAVCLRTIVAKIDRLIIEQHMTRDVILTGFRAIVRTYGEPGADETLATAFDQLWIDNTGDLKQFEIGEEA